MKLAKLKNSVKFEKLKEYNFKEDVDMWHEKLYIRKIDGSETTLELSIEEKIPSIIINSEKMIGILLPSNVSRKDYGIVESYIPDLIKDDLVDFVEED